MKPEQRELNESWGKLEGYEFIGELIKGGGKDPMMDFYFTHPNDTRPVQMASLPNWAGDANLFFGEVVPRMAELGFDIDIQQKYGTRNGQSVVLPEKLFVFINRSKKMKYKSASGALSKGYLKGCAPFIHSNEISTAGLSSAIKACVALEAGKEEG